MVVKEIELVIIDAHMSVDLIKRLADPVFSTSCKVNEEKPKLVNLHVSILTLFLEERGKNRVGIDFREKFVYEYLDPLITSKSFKNGTVNCADHTENRS